MILKTIKAGLFVVALVLALQVSATWAAEAAGASDEAPAPIPAKVTKVEVREFPPLPHLTKEEKAENIMQKWYEAKYEFEDFMQATPERRELLKQFDALSDALVAFRANPSGFLKKAGVKDEEFLGTADKYFKKGAYSADWQKADKIHIRVLSCMTANLAGNVVCGVEARLAPDVFIKREYMHSPALSFAPSDNIKGVTVREIFPARIGGEVGYDKVMLLPFTVKINDTAKAVHIRGEMSGLLCEKKSGKCQPFALPFAREFAVNARIASPECAYVQDTYRRLRLKKDIEIVEAKWGDGTLNLVARAAKEYRKPDIFIDSADGIKFGKAIIARDGDLLKASVKIVGGTVPPEGLAGKELGVIFGYPVYFTAGVVVPATTGAALAGDNIALPKNNVGKTVTPAAAFGVGVMLVFLSPLLSLLLMMSFRGKKQEIPRESAFAAGTVTLLYPALMYLVGGVWGEQFTVPAFVFIFAATIAAAGLMLTKATGARGLGVIFAFLAFISPVHFITGAVESAKVLDFIFLGLGVFFGFAVALIGAEVVAKIAPLPIRKIGRALDKDRYKNILILLPSLVTAGWLLTILLCQYADMWEVWVIAFLTLCIIKAARLKKYLVGFIFFLITLPFLSFSNMTPEDNFNKDNMAKVLESGKIAYVVVDTPWCITCQLGKASFFFSPAVHKMVETGEIVMMRASPANPVIKDLVDNLGIDARPLHILYSASRPEGEIMPWFVQTYRVLGQLNKVGWSEKRREKEADKPK